MSCDLQALNQFLASRTYVDGFSASSRDIDVLKALGSCPDSSSFPHVARFFKHVSAINPAEQKRLRQSTASVPGLTQGGTAAPKPTSAAKPTAQKPTPAATKEVDSGDLANLVLAALEADGSIQDSLTFAAAQGVDHGAVVEVLKTLTANEYVELDVVTRTSWALTKEAESFKESGSPEFRLFAALSEAGDAVPDLKAKLGDDLVSIGMAQGLKARWFQVEKGEVPRLKKQVKSVEDEIVSVIRNVEANLDSADAATITKLKQRKCIAQQTNKSFSVKRGAKFQATFNKMQADLTKAMISSREYDSSSFKPLRLDVCGRVPAGGYLHPLLKVREEFRAIFLELGFEEMPTNRFVESSFWNFDALFQPQAHPARDAHDTFFISNPSETLTLPADYTQKVKTMHESGDHESRGWRYDWQESEARKNILRTHTTAISSQMLYQLAKNGFKPTKLFSIDRVFRNEKLDFTHLAEFHQIEGVVCDRNLGLADLMGIIKDFYERLGMNDIRFKPAYNPYTEPSMEIFYVHPDPNVGMMEIGNSGVFRPEMLRPMGLPDDCTVIAWGLGLERPTMIKYGLSNIRELFGHQVKFDNIKNNPICRMDK